MLVKDKPTKYYVISGASVGLQAGGQAYSYAIFFMSDEEEKQALDDPKNAKIE